LGLRVAIDTPVTIRHIIRYYLFIVKPLKVILNYYKWVDKY